jgi:hypothetical protein
MDSTRVERIKALAAMTTPEQARKAALIGLEMGRRAKKAAQEAIAKAKARR